MREISCKYKFLLSVTEWKLCTVCPRSLDPIYLVTFCPGSSDIFNIVTYYIKWVTILGHTVYEMGQDFLDIQNNT